MRNIALLRCAKKPNFITWDIGDIQNFFEDDKLLITAFAEKGHHAIQVIWNDRSVEWTQYDIVLIRSAWDYIDHCDEFLEVLRQIEMAGCQLYNSHDIVSWNADKMYLVELQQHGVAVIPTFQASGNIQDYFEKNNWVEAIIKPRIGGGAANILKINTSHLQDHLDALTNKDDFLAQPMIPAILTEGEYSYIYMDDKLSYVHLKKPATGDYRVQGIYGGSLEVIFPDQADIDQVNAIYAQIPFNPLYARIDLVRMEKQLVVMELEMIEPILNFSLSPEGLEEFVSAVLSRKPDTSL